MRPAPTKFLLLAALLGLAAVATAGFILFDALVIEPNWVTVTTVRIRHPALARVLQGRRIVQVSDLHIAGELGFREKSLIERINRLHPDCVLFTGDYVESSRAAPLVARLVSRLRPGMWCYGILGNADRAYLQGDDFVLLWKRSGLSLIGGKSLKMRFGNGEDFFWLAGVDYGGEGGISAALEGIPRNEPLVVLSASPDLAPALIEQGADLVLSGDTHGGQVGLPAWGRFLESYGRSPFLRGLFPLPGGWLYVNRGIGSKPYPVRFLCPPEITLFKFTE
jgi:hypothetical protein